MTYSDLSQRVPEGIGSIDRKAHLFTIVTALLVFAALIAITAPGARAISDEEELTSFGSKGFGAGQLSAPSLIAADPVTGHIYVADEGSSYRIHEFTPWGDFVKAFGWDVAPGAVNEQQEVRVRAAAGQFKLTFGASTTADLAFNAPGSESEGPESVEAALNALPSIGEVSVKAVPGTPDGKAPFIYVVAFKGSQAGTDVTQQLTITDGTTQASGGVPSTSLEARTRVDGTPGGTGLESCTAESGCKAGLEGDGAGQGRARGIAVDATGDIYVKEVENLRVQKFDSTGRFLLMFGGEVNKTTKENICTKVQLEGGDECGAGIPGSGPGEFSAGSSYRGIALGSGGQILAADNERIERFNLQGEFEASIPVPGEQVLYLAFDPISEDLYATFSGLDHSGVHKLDSTTGAELAELAGQGLLAVDPVGNLFAGGASGENQGKVMQYDSGGKPLSPSSCCEVLGAGGINGLGTNAAGNLYVSYIGSNPLEAYIRAFGPAPVKFEAAPKVPPSITGQFATSVDRNGATVAAEINPHFWSDTHYYVEYGTGKCSEGGCTETKLLPPGALLTAKVTDLPVRSAGISLEGLQPGTTYHYRFVAQSSGGGPVHGVDDEVGVDGGESTFITYPTPTPAKIDCPNQAFRTGFSAPLTDCRAYEMVSPVDKNNGDIKALLDLLNYTTALSQSAEDGGRFTYSSSRSFGAPKGAPYINQYLARRDPASGWSSEAISAPQVTRFTGVVFENTYKAFSADLCSGWLVVKAEPALAPGAGKGFELYRREGCGAESYEALVGTEPPPGEAFLYPVLQGTSADGKAAVFGAEDKLTPDAAGGGAWQSYYTKEGQLRLLCVGPSGLPSGNNCSPGTGPTFSAGSSLAQQERFSSVTHALSADGSKAYWTDAEGAKFGPGKVYLRLNPGEEQSEVLGGECTEAEKACTLKVSETVTPQPSRFLRATPDGTKAFFQVTAGAAANKLFRFDLQTGASEEIAAKVLGVAGASEDLSRIYLISEEAIAGTTGATAGKPNLYLVEGEEEKRATFIATISKTDAGTRVPSNAPLDAIYHAARATPDGRVLTFISAESLTGYDNTDLVNGEADSEIYRYEVGSAGPVCVSCNPSGARPTGRVVESNGQSGSLAIASFLTMPESSLYSPRVLSADGSRIFFNSFDPLLLRDTNGKTDVYEWQAASGAKDCEEKGAELYVQSSAGCLSLISSGQSPSDSEFLDASKDGNDAFFTTSASLLIQDPGLVDVYDARANGGLPAPPSPPGPCQGEACQFAPPPPNDPTPASASFKGAGNLKPTPRCAKGKVARKGRCVARKRKQAKKHKRARSANHNRRMGR